jgi:Na+-transporting methylmalonyl-CoA/oxaloacetate decarboxylase gamma subunit
MESILIALKMMGFGLGGVFISLILLYVLIRVTGGMFRKKDKEQEQENVKR